MHNDAVTLDRIIQALTDLKHTSDRQEENLRVHMRRWEASEARIGQVEGFVTETRAYMYSLRILGVVVAGTFGIAATIVAIVALIHTW